MPATLPWPKMPKQPPKNRWRTPSRSTCCAARKRTSACAAVSLIVAMPPLYGRVARAEQLRPVQVVAVGRREHARAVAALLVDRERALHAGDASPVDDARSEQHAEPVRVHLQPVVEPADHDRADGRHRADVLAGLL